jgi:hypothetical protein
MPHVRLLQHRRNPPRLVQAALQTSVDEIVYVPLQVVTQKHADQSERYWSLKADASLNAFGIRGPPGTSRRFWAMLGRKQVQRKQTPKKETL